MSTDTQTGERPIDETAEMVRAILDGRKTQTRRVMKRQPGDEWSPDYYGMFQPTEGGEPMEPDPKRDRWGVCNCEGLEGYFCPYGQPGDRLWVRETWRFEKDGSEYPRGVVRYRADDAAMSPPLDHPTDGTSCPMLTAYAYASDKWRWPTHMPRWASRLGLELVSVRVERLQNISDADARAEGCLPTDAVKVVEAFSGLWDSINAKRGHPWASNPWVWVLEFRRENDSTRD